MRNLISASLTNGTLQLIVIEADGSSTIIPVRNDHPKWNELMDAYKLRDYEKVLELSSLKTVIEKYSVGLLSVNSTGIIYAGAPLHGVDSDRVIAFLNKGLPFEPIANYMERKMRNPSARAIKELYNFLEHKNMPLTPEGKIIAYKGVQDNYYSVMGNTSTVVLKGTVDEGGHILNKVGETIEIARSSCDDDFRNGCSFGIHAGSMTYAKGWGKRVLLVEIDPADVVSVPEDCSCQKLRCCKYKVLAEFTGAMPDSFTSEFNSPSKEITSGETITDDGFDWESDDEFSGDNDPGFSLPSENDQQTASSFLKGIQDAQEDARENRGSKYIVSDAQSGDSDLHNHYIDGYLYGMMISPSSKGEQ